jgi:hypothetical protein
MSMDARRAWEEHSQAQGNAYIVGKQLAIYAEKVTDLAWAGDGDLMRACRLSRRSVQRALRELETLREIVRQPPQAGRRRLYLVDPAGRSQLVLFSSQSGASAIPQYGLAQSATRGTVPPVAQSATSDQDCASHVRAGSSSKELVNSTPPTPRPGGSAHSPDLLRSITTPRRRRRRGLEPVVAQPCPLPDHDPSERELFARRWADVLHRLSPLLPETTVEIWLADAHLHELDPLTIAVDAQRIAWIAGRFAPVLQRVAGTDVQLVACDHVGVRR